MTLPDDQPIHSPDRQLSCHPELVSGSITSAARRQRLKAQVCSKVAPMRVSLFDQVDLPLPPPVLDLLLTSNRIGHRVEYLHEDEPINRVLGGESGGFSFAMLPKPGRQIRRNAGVERAAITARQNVGARLAVALHSQQNDGRWTLESQTALANQVQHDITKS